MKTSIRHWKIWYGGFWHHFLDFRDYPPARTRWGDRTILELVRLPVNGVRRVTWQQVVDDAGGAVPVLVCEVEGGLEAVFRRAKDRLLQKGYRLLSYNCEHFANECLTGHRWSSQVAAKGAQLGTAGAASTGFLLSSMGSFDQFLAYWIATGSLFVLASVLLLLLVSMARCAYALVQIARRAAQHNDDSFPFINHAV